MINPKIYTDSLTTESAQNYLLETEKKNLRRNKILLAFLIFDLIIVTTVTSFYLFLNNQNKSQQSVESFSLNHAVPPTETTNTQLIIENNVQETYKTLSLFTNNISIQVPGLYRINSGEDTITVLTPDEEAIYNIGNENDDMLLFRDIGTKEVLDSIRLQTYPKAYYEDLKKSYITYVRINQNTLVFEESSQLIEVVKGDIKYYLGYDAAEFPQTGPYTPTITMLIQKDENTYSLIVPVESLSGNNVHGERQITNSEKAKLMLSVH